MCVGLRDAETARGVPFTPAGGIGMLLPLGCHDRLGPVPRVRSHDGASSPVCLVRHAGQCSKGIDFVNMVAHWCVFPALAEPK